MLRVVKLSRQYWTGDTPQVVFDRLSFSVEQGETVALLGASGQTLEFAIRYGSILLPSIPILVIGMSAAAAVRAIGDARRAMWATLIGSIVNAILDPIFIFGFDWGLEGAAWASVVARLAVLLTAWRALVGVHKLPRRVSYDQFRSDLTPLLAIAGPAVLTNLATFRWKSNRYFEIC